MCKYVWTFALDDVRICIMFVDSAKNLGSVLNFEEQVDKLVKFCYLTIRKL